MVVSISFSFLLYRKFRICLTNASGSAHTPYPYHIFSDKDIAHLSGVDLFTFLRYTKNSCLQKRKSMILSYGELFGLYFMFANIYFGELLNE